MPRILKISEKGQSVVEVALVVFLVLVFACSLGALAVEIAHPFVEANNCREFDGTLIDTYAEGGNTAFEIMDDTGDTEIYVNNDNWLIGKVNSRENLVDNINGARYHFEVCGTRWPLMSWSPNLISKYRLDQ